MKYLIVAFVSVLLLLCAVHQVYGGVSACYSCAGSCERPTVENCPTLSGNFNCVSVKMSQNGVISYVKGCVGTSAPSVCVNSPAILSCYYCGTNYCNNHD